MDKQLLDYDPLTLTTTWHYYDEATDQTTIEEVQDMAPHLERAKALRNDTNYSNRGIKGDMWHYAIIPNAVITQLAQRGIDVFNKTQAKEVMRIINTEYPGLKTTAGTHR